MASAAESGPDVKEIILEHLHVLQVHPGDTLVLRFPGVPSVSEIDAIYTRMLEVFSEDVHVLVLCGGVELGVVRSSAEAG